MRSKHCLGKVLMLGIYAAFFMLPALLSAADQNAPKETFTGTLVGIGGSLGGKSIPFTMEVSGVTTDEDTAKYLEVLKNKGQDGLLKALEKNKFGWFKLDSTSSAARGLNLTRWTYDLLAVRIQKTESGRLFKILLERTPSWYELREGGRSLDYKFTFIEMYVKDDGKGEGSLVGAAKIRWTKKEEVELESFGNYPAKIMGLMKR